MPLAPFDQPLVEFEVKLDESIEKSELWALPRHLALGMLLGPLRDLMLGGLDTAFPPRPRAGQSWMDRLPALVPLLRRTSADHATGKPIKVPEAGGVVAMAEVMSYAHAAELYPELWRKWRVVKAAGTPGSGAAGHDLTEDEAPVEVGSDHQARAYVVGHASEEAAAWEVRDIVLARLAGPWGVFDTTHPPLDDHVSAQLTEPGVPLGVAAPTLALAALGALRLEELPMVSDDAMAQMVGVTCGEFMRFRDACVALGFALTEAAEFCMRRARETSGDDSVRWASDAATWSLPMLRFDDAVEWFWVLCGLERDQIGRLVGAFSEPHDGSGWNYAGDADMDIDGMIDGFFPPFWPVSRDGESLLAMCPWHLQSNVLQHSLVSRYSKVMAGAFDGHVSSSLEPTLLELIAPLWRRVPNVVVVLNRTWVTGKQRSEFDALVYDPSVNTVVHVQAKGSIPAISPRMVARLESTVAVGVRQLKALRSLSPSERDRVLSTALGVPVSNPDVLDVLMTSSGIGSAKAWESLGAVVPLNPVLLSAAVDSALSAGTSNVVAVVAHASALLNSLVVDANPVWKVETVPLGLGSEAGSVTVTFPSLSLDSTKIATFRKLAWPR